MNTMLVVQLQEKLSLFSIVVLVIMSFILEHNLMILTINNFIVIFNDKNIFLNIYIECFKTDLSSMSYCVKKNKIPIDK